MLTTACHSPSNTYQVVLSTAHPAKFSEAVSRALEGSPSFNFDRDVLPKEFEGLLEREKRVIDVERADIDLVKAVIEDVAQKQTKAGNSTSTGSV
jgi:threonine synthase